jgi:1-hydroxycarotenoid 3,4-desaturase
MPTQRVVIVGAGIAGLVAAALLSARGMAVTVVERNVGPGGKMRQIVIGDATIDVGPTVLTLRPVFEQIFDSVGASLSQYVVLRPSAILARHAWSGTERLDLFTDIERSADGIGRFAGPREARGYRAFCERARRIYEILEGPFIQSARPSLPALVAAFGLRRLGELWQITPFVSLWNTLGEYFDDPRLRQLFGRYATYCGSSPFLAPATLMVVAHVEREGVWLVEGGMHRIAEALVALGTRAGATIRYRSEASDIITATGRVSGVRLASGEYLDADAVVLNADVSAICRGRFGRQVASAVPTVRQSARSLSAITWAMVAPTSGFPLVRHNVFFSRDYAAEFTQLGAGKLPGEPTVYVCAQDRKDEAGTVHPNTNKSAEALLCLVNAPPNGDHAGLDSTGVSQCEERTFALLERCGLHIARQSKAVVTTTPADFEQLYPGTGGSLYGPASHGWMASFRRSGSCTRMPGLYLAGGSTHPGPGVPMAAISGRLAAQAILADFASTGRSRPAGMRGGTSML